MPYLRDLAIVLKKEPFREQDRRYTLYGREHGLLQAVARGSSLKSAKQAGHLEPFSLVDVMIAKGVTFDKLAVARSLDRARPLDPTLGGYAVLGAFHDLVISLLRQGVSDARIFDLLLEVRRVCFHFPLEPSSERARLLLAAATLKLLDLLGFGPPLSSYDGELPRAAALISFARRAPLADIVRVTATVDILNAASNWIEDAVRQTPLETAPRGPFMLRALLA
ncbi:MAG: recombination protein O N-terminal domain-containing protein [Patescibacteria group bacterium]|jgi:DNA repair protein RecO